MVGSVRGGGGSVARGSCRCCCAGLSFFDLPFLVGGLLLERSEEEGGVGTGRSGCLCGEDVCVFGFEFGFGFGDGLGKVALWAVTDGGDFATEAAIFSFLTFHTFTTGLGVLAATMLSAFTANSFFEFAAAFPSPAPAPTTITGDEDRVKDDTGVSSVALLLADDTALENAAVDAVDGDEGSGCGCGDGGGAAMLERMLRAFLARSA
ncbi:hypothetical protein B0H34DRAFT_472118 [Crassisporium funariophilum]|nr:hypothetical protein B0H34DRAFT_472118 [Crassisporium funariophilum]